jgi:hypothetical protein
LIAEKSFEFCGGVTVITKGELGYGKEIEAEAGIESAACTAKR